jgi:hypothetical protein
MTETLIKSIWLAWLPVVAILFRAIEPRRAVLVAVLGGLLFLPAGHLRVGPPSFTIQIDRWVTTGLGLILGALAFDRRSLSRFRPRWLDLPMVAYALFPLIGLATGVPGSAIDVLDAVTMRGLGWGVPYLMGRIYFGQGDGPARVCIALTIAGMAYIPLCLYEEFAGPPRYLAVLLYGAPNQGGLVERLGGWRPEVFLGSGLTLGSWMALTTVTATWLWLGKTWRLPGWPSWVPPLALLATTISCRGVYSYILLTIGILTAFLTRWFRTRVILTLLAVVPFTYMGLRASGLWDGRQLEKGAVLLGRPGTVAARLKAEDEIIHRVLARNPAFGFGNDVYRSDAANKPDSLWLQALWMGGLAGLAVHMTAVFVLPAALGLSKPWSRPDRRQAASPTWALACWCLLQLIEGMHNSTNFSVTALIGGTLIGLFLNRDVAGSAARPKDWSFEPARPILSLPLLIAAILLIGIEYVGNLPRTPAPEPPASTPGKASPAVQPDLPLR